MNSKQRVTARFTDAELEMMKNAVDLGMASNMSDLIRKATILFLDRLGIRKE